jgi:hypothetical protein
MRIFRCPYMQSGHIVYTTSRKYCLVSIQHIAQTLWGVYSLVRHPKRELETKMFAPLQQPFYWLYMANGQRYN